MNTIPIMGGNTALPLRQNDNSEISKAKNTFSEFLILTINQVNQTEGKGDMAIQKLNTGNAKNLHEVMIAVEEADISIRMLVQMRNKALEAYNEIMRMQI